MVDASMECTWPYSDLTSILVNASVSTLKICSADKQMTEVTYKPTLELGTSLLSLERALSCHLVFLC
jgi:hypothetical protein